MSLIKGLQKISWPVMELASWIWGSEKSSLLYCQNTSQKAQAYGSTYKTFNFLCFNKGIKIAFTLSSTGQGITNR